MFGVWISKYVFLIENYSLDHLLKTTSTKTIIHVVVPVSQFSIWFGKDETENSV